MKADPNVFVMGEDVGLQGGVFGCTRGLMDEFGEERVRDTPISELGYVGVGIGAALTGMRPVIDFMYMDFTYVAMDQILNQAAKLRYMYGGKATLPLVIRGQQGIGRGNAGTHSQSVEAFFTHIPGLKVAQPSSARDAAGLLRTAIRDNNPIMFFEHKALYATSEEVPDDPNFAIPFGVADIKREGSDVTIVATSLMVSRALEAADILAKDGIQAEVVDPGPCFRWIWTQSTHRYRKPEEWWWFMRRIGQTASVPKSHPGLWKTASNTSTHRWRDWARKPVRCRSALYWRTPLCPVSTISSARSGKSATDRRYRWQAE
jgi:pyruvate/2-oxoglutarate/acetoin dehydrogenase E1 component